MTKLTKNIQLIEVYLDIGSGKHGTIEGVTALAQACLYEHPSITTTQIFPDNKTNRLVHEQPKYAKAKYIEALAPFFDHNLIPVVQQVLSTNKFPIIVSSNHTNAIGNVAAFLEHHKDKRVGVIWIDAHADLHSVYTTPSGNMHGTPLAAILRMDNLDCRINEVPSEVAAFWKRMQYLASSHTNGVLPQDLYFLGLRSFEEEESYLIKKHGIFQRSATAHRQEGINNVLDKIIPQLQQLDTIYISFDIDALDDTLVPATGTPEPHGYTMEEMRQILDKLLALPNLGLFEITEFNPTLDSDFEKHQSIYDLLHHAIDVIAPNQSPNT
ncbi:MAG: arginase family protein [Cardiobacteriaceae bacterium]|nr:arginase family protein [Cardiobacteriaceae bacterium]